MTAKLTKIYQYKRGLDYSVKVVYNDTSNGPTITYHDIRTPEGTPNEVIEQLLAEAETAVIKKLEEAEGIVYAIQG